MILGLLLIALGIAAYRAGYCHGRADGIEWTEELYNGENEEFEQMLRDLEEEEQRNLKNQ
jgi:hypothetical protein